jgi:DNA adenine methylase
MKTDEGIQPFLKWTGGKRWLTSELKDLVPVNHGRYFEPFLGGGALYFRLLPYPASLTDTNSELINAYRQVRDNCEQVIHRLQRLPISSHQFLKMRSARPRTLLTQAVRFLYLNRTAYNGIYRVNQRGEFNVPFGCKSGTQLCNPEHLRQAARALAKRKLLVSDFEAMIDSAMAEDVVYADPPYTSLHNNNGFRRYNEKLFTWNDQERLADACMRAAARGVHVIVSNADHVELRALYPEFQSITRSRYSSIGSSRKFRRQIDERVF